MEVSVELQSKYSYIFWPLVLFFAMVVVLVLVFVIRKKIKNRPAKIIDIEQAWRALSDQEKYALKMKYFSLLDVLYVRVAGNQISIRACYQCLSRYVREFVSDITGIRVNRCTLSDIKQMNMPMLAALIEEYYEVEFAKVSAGNAEDAIARTKRVIELWN